MKPKIVIETHNLSSHPERLQKTGIQEVVYSVLRASASVRRRFAPDAEIMCLPQVLDDPSRPAPFAPALNNTAAHLREAERLIGLSSPEIWGWDLAAMDYCITPERARELLGDASWLLVTSHVDPARLEWLMPQSASKPRKAAIFYDVIPQLFPELVPPRIGHWYDQVFCQSLRERVSAFFPISRSAALDLQMYCLERPPAPTRAPAPADQAVIYRPLCITPIAGTHAPYWPELEGRPYFLVVGSTDPRKNTVGLLLAFERWLELFPPAARQAALVIAGPKDWHFGPVAEAIASLRARFHVVTTGYLSDGELHGAVQGSIAVLMPSRYEGYGLPLALARCYGKPALTCANSSLPEAVGCQAAFARPWSPDDMALALQLLFTEEKSSPAQASGPVSADSWETYLSDLIATLLDFDKVSGCVS